MKNKLLFISILVVIISLMTGVVGCISSEPSKKSTGKSSPKNPPATQEPGTSKAASVKISNSAFNPATVTISKGGKVIWTNNDSVSHTVTANNGDFDSGELGADKTFIQIFDRAGTFEYHCTIHPSMTAKVEVK